MLTFIETKLFTRLVRGGACPGAETRWRSHYLRLHQGQVWMLTLNAKNEAESISGATLKKIKGELDGKD